MNRVKDFLRKNPGWNARLITDASPGTPLPEARKAMPNFTGGFQAIQA
jgi:hypothetical protein